MMIKNMFKVISIFRLENSLKNILIFFPLLFSKKIITDSGIENLFFGFLFFIFMTSICYVTNDYSDRFIDKINKLKKNKNYKITKKIVILLNLILGLTILILALKTNIINYYIPVYLSLFFSYNFFFKRIKFFDILFLVAFYIVRLFYGAEISNVNISYWFIIFFISIFLILALFKRMLQIFNNQLKNKNKIIQYSYKNIPFFKKTIISAAVINSLTLLTFIGELSFPNTLNYFSSDVTKYSYNIYFLCVILLLYIYWLSRTINMVFKHIIKQDFYSFIIRDKITYIIMLSTIFVILYKG
ncbi:UbiA family prenyltransferase [Candidatus Pelagibacter sp.]|jgi:4-hydroxybenzoate polyprenyltransferase|nr:UbiA family prenyltransferase [Candidatus Pelagibacter sp.]|tara:strand:- start:428 stop:1327 length:900 start_codon:yes stop_codon:yes gene_type:complete